MKVLITGGCGLVGRWFAKRFLDRGDRVSLVDDLSTGLEPAMWAFRPKDSEAIFYRADVRDWIRVHEASEFDLIVHCAAIVGGRLKIEGDPLGVATDLSIDAQMFDWVVRAKPMPKVIYFSSSAAYATELQTEKTNCYLSEHLLNFNGNRVGMPDMTYGWSKLSGEYLAKVAVDRYGADVRVYRPFGGYAEDQDFSYPFPSIIKRVVERQDPVVVWGSGNQARDFIHMSDVVNCVLTTMDQLKPGEALNIGTGRGTSFRELAEMACDILGHKADIVSAVDKPQGVFRRVSDPYKMHTMFRPEVTLAAGIRRVARHLQKQLDGAQVSV